VEGFNSGVKGLIITTDCTDFLAYVYITNYINLNVTQQDTHRMLPDDDVHTPIHLGAVECNNKFL
jgi:hypothetical protein